MSRFTGWTKSAVDKINNKKAVDHVISKNCLTNNQYERIKNALKLLKVEAVLEYKFVTDRRFRFDLAIPEHKIAVEFEGGVYTRGRHTRSRGYINDCKKYNLAVMHGWRLLRYTVNDTRALNWEFEIANEIKRLIDLTSPF